MASLSVVSPTEACLQTIKCLFAASKTACYVSNTCTCFKTSKRGPGRVAQSVTCLATDASLTADPGVASSIPARDHTFVEIDHEIISTVILLPSAESFKKGFFVSYKRKYVHEVLVHYSFKLAQEKVWLGELTVPPLQ